MKTIHIESHVHILLLELKVKMEARSLSDVIWVLAEQSNFNEIFKKHGEHF